MEPEAQISNKHDPFRRAVRRLTVACSRIQETLLNVPLPFKIMGMVLGLTCLIGAVIAYRVHHVLEANMNSFLEVESRSYAAEFAERSGEYLLTNDLYGLASMLKSMTANRPDLRYVVVLDSRNHILAHSFEGGFPVDLLNRLRNATSPDLVRTDKLLTNEGAVWESAHPILKGEIGSVRAGLTARGLRSRNNHFVHTLILNTLMIAAAATLGSACLTWLITKPVKDLIQAIRKVRQGDYSVEFPAVTRDEVGWLIDSFKKLVSQLREAERERLEKEQMRKDFLQRTIATQENERKRIARELHDQTGQALASLMVSLKMLENSTNFEEGKKGLVLLKKAITKEMDAIHGLALELRPRILDDLGLVSALELYLADFKEKHGIRTTLVAIGFEHQRPALCTETCIYRIVQESLTNVARHAKASSVSIILEWNPERLRGVIEDDGIGFEAAVTKSNPARLGLYGMEERALLLGGSFRVDSEPGQGTMIIFELPAEQPRYEQS